MGDVRIVPGLWLKEPGVDGGRLNGIPYSFGDFYVPEDRAPEIESLNIDNSTIFDGLLPHAEWIGKQIQEVVKFEGSEVNCHGGSGILFRDGASMLVFTDGTKGKLYCDGGIVVYSFDSEGPDLDLMVKAGAFTREFVDERRSNKKLHSDLKEHVEGLQKERSRLQQGLLEAPSKKDQRSIYNLIEETEKDISVAERQIQIAWSKISTVLNFDWLVNWLPDMVDILGVKSADKITARKTDELGDPIGKSIKTIHLVYDATGSERSHNVYMMEFADGTYSLPFGEVGGNDVTVDFMLDSLSPNIITQEQLREAHDHISHAVSRTDIDRSRSKQLNDLKASLETHGLGAKRTLAILEEIALLEQSTKEPVVQEV